MKIGLSRILVILSILFLIVLSSLIYFVYFHGSSLSDDYDNSAIDFSRDAFSSEDKEKLIINREAFYGKVEDYKNSCKPYVFDRLVYPNYSKEEALVPFTRNLHNDLEREVGLLYGDSLEWFESKWIDMGAGSYCIFGLSYVQGSKYISYISLGGKLVNEELR